MILPFHFLSSQQPLQAADAVAALLILEDGRYILQLRDDISPIWYPGHWGLFGGSVNPGEDDIAALRRELKEELEIEFDEARLFTNFEFDLSPIGLRRYFRKYYEIQVAAPDWERAVLHEGSDVRALPGDEALALPLISPYDAFALFLHARRDRMNNVGHRAD
jgi:8-oxo-dGTP pyrophosphatase MutT (NUDIX family)